MSEYMYLVGTEEMRSAGSSMCAAAEELSRGVGNLDEVLGRNLRTLESLVERMEVVVSSARLPE